MKNLSLIIASAFAICSCSTSKTVGQATDLNGEWDIVEVNGKVVDTTKTEARPFIGFETSKNNVYGCAGCNNITGTMKLNTSRHTLDLSQVGATMMLCHDMTTEQSVLDALGHVKGYKATGEGRVDLTDNSGKTVLSLQKAK